LEERGVPHVLAVKRTEPRWAATARGPAQGKAADLVAALPAAAWTRLSAGAGATGPRLDDGARVPIRPLADPDRGSWLPVRRRLTDPADLAHDACYGPAGAPLADLVRVAGTRWAVEAAIEAAKGEVGLDQDAVRRGDGWYRPVTRCLLAHAFLAAAQAGARGDAAPAAVPPPSRGSLAAFRARRRRGSA
jgi:hypothetical protein